MDALTVANTGSPEVFLPDNDGKATLTGTVIALSNIDNTTIANFDLSAATFGGTALSTFNCDNITIQNNNATNRSAGINVANSIVSTITNNTLTNHNLYGISVSNGQNSTITNNTFTNTGTQAGQYSLLINGVSTDGTKRLEVTGNTFNGGGNGISLSNMDALTIANTGNPEVFLPDTDGKKTFTGTALNVSACTGAMVQHLDLGYLTSTGVSGIGLAISSSPDGTFSNISASKRSSGILVLNSPNTTINGALLQNNTAGVRIQSTTGQNNAGTVVSNSNFSCNTHAIRNEVSNNETYTASNNFWGAADGAATDGGSGDAYFLASGAGLSGTTSFLSAPNANIPLTQPQMGSIGITGGACPGDTDVELTANATCGFCVNGTADLQYSLNGGTFQSSNTFSGLGAGTYTIAVREANYAGCESSLTQNIVIQDTQQPSITCPANISTQSTSGAGATVNFADATATDNCTVNVVQTAGLISGSTFPSGTSTVEFTATDAGNNMVTCSFTVNITGTAPDVVCPDNITVSNDTGDCAAIVSFTATDATGVPASTITDSQDPGTSFRVGTTTVTATATNAVGSDDCMFTVTVNDTEAPTITCPADITVDASAGICEGVTVQLVDPTVSDNCGEVTLAFSGGETIDPFFVGERGGNTLTSFDVNGNRTVIASIPSANGVVFLDSETALVTSHANGSLYEVNITTGVSSTLFTVPVINNTGLHGIAIDVDGRVLVVNEGVGQVLRYDVNSGVLDTLVSGLDRPAQVVVESPTTLLISEYDLGKIVRYNKNTNTVTDYSTGHGAPTDIFLEANGDLLVAENGGQVSRVSAGVRTNFISIGGSPFGPHGVAKDDAGNIYVAVYSSGQVRKYDPTGAALATFTGFNKPVYMARNPSNIFTEGTTTLTWTATDGNGLTNQCQQTITVQDNEPPAAPALAEVTINCGETVPAPTTGDNCDGTITATTTDATSFSGTGQYTITWTFADDSNNSVNVAQTVNVVDNTAPTFTCPTNVVDITLNVCNEYELTPADLGLSGTDNCGGEVTFTLSPTSISGAGTETITVTASDGMNNTDGSCTVDVTFVTNPEFFTITTDNEDLGTSCPDEAVTFTAATLLDGDVASNGATLEVQEVNLVNPADGTIVDDGPGTFTFIPAAGVTGSVAMTYVVKTEGSDLFFADNGHFYEFIVEPNITWTDAAAAAAARTLNGQTGYLATITSASENAFIVDRLQGNGWIGASDNEQEGVWKWVTGPEAGQQFWSGLGQNAGGMPVNGAYNNWDISPSNIEPNNLGGFENYAHLVGNPPNGAEAPLGTWNDWENNYVQDINGYVVEYGAVDCVPDQTAVGSITLNIEDTTPPVITCPVNIEVVATSAAGAVVTFADATATDNCTVSVVRTAGLASGATFPIGVSTVTYTATDAGDNEVSCSFTVNITGTAPDVVCPDNITVSNDTGDCAAIVSFTATDATGVPASTITYSQNPGTSFPVGTTTVTATATNAVGIDDCMFTVTVDDTTPPTFTCPTATTLTLDLCNEYTLTPADLGLSGTDNCGGK
ncbi:MAG: HYR domain-containing protein [Saprospiraceae bacterium]